MEDSITTLREELASANNRLEYERNKYERLLATREEGISNEIESKIHLEMVAMFDMLQYLDDDNRRRFSRRLHRIEDILHRFNNE